MCGIDQETLPQLSQLYAPRGMRRPSCSFCPACLTGPATHRLAGQRNWPRDRMREDRTETHPFQLDPRRKAASAVGCASGHRFGTAWVWPPDQRRTLREYAQSRIAAEGLSAQPPPAGQVSDRDGPGVIRAMTADGRGPRARLT